MRASGSTTGVTLEGIKLVDQKVMEKLIAEQKAMEKLKEEEDAKLGKTISADDVQALIKIQKTRESRLAPEQLAANNAKLAEIMGDEEKKAA
jgi:hypothetical protein